MRRIVFEMAILDFLEVCEEGLPDVSSEGEVGVFAFAGDVDQARGFEFFEVVGEGCGGDGHAGAEVSTCGGVVSLREPLDDFEAAGFAESLEDGHALGGRQHDGGRWFALGRHVRIYLDSLMLLHGNAGSRGCWWLAAILAAMIPIGSNPGWHPVFEALAYVSGYAVFRRLRDMQGDVVAKAQRWSVLAGAAVGALVGSRLLGLAEQWPTVMAAWRAGHLLALVLSPGGKTIVGGLLGGWLGVEVIKKLNGIRNRTGDLLVLPLCVGMAIGRVGCLIAGLADDTYGKATRLPWAVDLGDGVGRHPVQVYEILVLTLIAFAITRLGSQMTLRAGARFRIFLASYLGWRLVIDFLKPQPLVGGLNLIQWSCLAVLVFLWIDVLRNPKEQNETLRA